MDARSWWKSVGTEEAQTVVAAAGTNWAYFVHIAAGRKRPSPELCLKLIEASGGVMTLEGLLFPPHAKWR